MKTRSREQKLLFTLLIIASVAAIAAGGYLGVALGMQVQAAVTVLSAAGILLWTAAWGAFIALCLRLRKGESAFTPATGKALGVIGSCMVTLAAISCLAAFIGSERAVGFFIIEAVGLPGFFLAAAVAARILRSLLEHAIAIEMEQEGVV